MSYTIPPEETRGETAELNKQAIILLEEYILELWDIYATERKKLEIKKVKDYKIIEDDNLNVWLPILHNEEIIDYPIKLSDVKRIALKVINSENAILCDVDPKKYKVIQGLSPYMTLFDSPENKIVVTIRETINSTATPTKTKCINKYMKNKDRFLS